MFWFFARVNIFFYKKFWFFTARVNISIPRFRVVLRGCPASRWPRCVCAPGGAAAVGAQREVQVAVILLVHWHCCAVITITLLLHHRSRRAVRMNSAPPRDLGRPGSLSHAQLHDGHLRQSPAMQSRRLLHKASWRRPAHVENMRGQKPCV